MRIKSLLPLSALLVIPAMAQTTFEYEGLKYTVIDESAKTCMTTPGVYDETTSNGYPSVYAEGTLVIPGTVYNENTPYKVVEIGENSFVVTDITALYISEGIEKIDDQAFYGCYELETVDLPSTLTSIGKMAFCWDGEVSTLVCRADNPPVCGSYALYICDWESYAYNSNLKVYVPDAFLSQYQNSNDFEWYYLYYYYLPLSEYKGGTPEIPDTPENPDAGVSSVIDTNLPVEVYDIHGRKVVEKVSAADVNSLRSGLYIIRQGNAASKVIVR